MCNENRRHARPNFPIANRPKYVKIMKVKQNIGYKLNYKRNPSIQIEFVGSGLICSFQVPFFSILEFRRLPYVVVRNNAKPVAVPCEKTDLSVTSSKDKKEEI